MTEISPNPEAIDYSLDAHDFLYTYYLIPKITIIKNQIAQLPDETLPKDIQAAIEQLVVNCVGFVDRDTIVQLLEA